MSGRADSAAVTRRIGPPLVIGLREEASGAYYPLDPRRTGYVIGHGLHADLRLSDPYVSSFHCALIRCHRGELLVVDRNSRNGVHVDNVRIERAYLAPRSRLRVGKTTFVAVGRRGGPTWPAAQLAMLPALRPWNRALALLARAIGKVAGSPRGREPSGR